MNNLLNAFRLKKIRSRILFSTTFIFTSYFKFLYSFEFQRLFSHTYILHRYVRSRIPRNSPPLTFMTKLNRSFMICSYMYHILCTYFCIMKERLSFAIKVRGGEFLGILERTYVPMYESLCMTKEPLEIP